ncbi:MAG: hypothetical protein RI959_1433 [Pseudomonadota bacterium]|jgi:predicted porin
MKKTLIALAALASTAVFAQSSVTIDGAFRVGFVGDKAGVNSIGDDQSSGNNLNFKVVEDLGGGLKANARAQLRYRIANGDNTNTTGTNDALFHLAHVGLSGAFGAVDIGRIGFDQVWGYQMNGSSNGSNVNVSGTGGATEDGQWRYTAPAFVTGLKIQVGGAMKANTAGAKDSNHFLVTYAAGNFAATAVSERVQNGNEYLGVGASYNFGVAKVNVIYADEQTAAGVNVINGYALSATVPMDAFTFKVGFRDSESGAANTDTSKTSFGVDYALSKRTVAEANTYKVKGDAKQSYFVGVRHSF